MLYTKYMFGIYEIRADSHCYQADKFFAESGCFLDWHQRCTHAANAVAV